LRQLDAAPHGYRGVLAVVRITERERERERDRERERERDRELK
jgi:hypothetical protein